MAEKIVSPGVFTQENDLSFVPQGVAAIGAAVVGPTVKGPALVPTLVSSFGEYQTLFGTTFESGSDEVEYLTSLAAEQYLQNSGQLTVVRILGKDFSNASGSWATGFNGIPKSGSSTSGGTSETAPSSSNLTLTETHQNDGAYVSLIEKGNHYKFILTDTPKPDDNESEYLYYVLSGSSGDYSADVLTPLKDAIDNVTALGSANLVGATGLGYTASVGIGANGNADTSNYAFYSGSSAVALGGGVNLVSAFSQAIQLKTRGDGAIMNSSGSEGTNNVYTQGTADNLRWEISNVNESTGEFTLLIRRGNDTSNSKVILETWNNLSLDPKSNNYVRKIIGDQYYETKDATTSNPFLQLTGDYANKSAFVYVSDNLKTTNYLDENGNTASAAYTASLPMISSGSFAGGADGDNIGANGHYFDKISDGNAQGFNVDNTDKGGDHYKAALYLLKNQESLS